MSEMIVRKSRVMLFALLGLVAVAALTMWGCGTDGYTDPNASVTTTKTATALIEPATLKQWVDEGKLNSTDPAARDRVVVVTVATAAQYGTQHIPGAVLLKSDTELNMTRLEGVTATPTMVMDGPTIDALIARMGIDENTTIVFAASKGQNALQPARAYFTFRYWGFPKERLKILNGGENGWETAAAAGTWPASYALTATAPTVAPSTFSVKNLYKGSTANFALRTSIGEMIQVVDKVNGGTLTVGPTGNTSILDERGGNPAVYIANAGVDDFAQYAVAGAGNTSTYKDAATLAARLQTFNAGANKMNYVYCLSGVRASSVFFVLDGILGWPVTLYDGSWQQWAAYTSLAPAANLVAAPWRTNVVSPGTAINRTFNDVALPNPGAGLTLDPIANAMYGIADPRANQMLNEDKAYFTSGGATAPAAPSQGSGQASLC